MAAGIYPDRTGARNANYRGGFESTCSQCGKPVWVRPSRIHRAQRFCSKPCHSRWMSLNVRGAKTSSWAGGKLTVTCEQCGQAFFAPRAEERKYCSPTCVAVSKRRRVERNCEHCGQGFYIAPNQAETARFCSRACKHSHARKVRTPEDIIKRRLDLRVSSLMWYSLRLGKGKGGRSWKALVPYTVDELKAHLQKTMPDGYTWDDFVAGKLEIDHRIPRRAFNYVSPDDYDFERCWALENLQLLTAFDNNSKNAKLSKPFQPTLL